MNQLQSELVTSYIGLKKALVSLERALPVRQKFDKVKQLKHQLKKVGVSWVGLQLSETKHLAGILQEGEKINGAVYGHNEIGFVMLAATNKRLMFIDKKPLFSNIDEITYDVVSGVSLSRAWPFSTLTLYSRVSNFVLKTWNKNSAQIFIDFIEDRCLIHSRLMPRSLGH